MADLERYDGGNIGQAPVNFAALLCEYIGETVTIFTSSGGESGSGFTGVVLSVNNCFVRLISRIGPPPGCSLGNACSNFNVGHAGSTGAGMCGISGQFGGYGASQAPGYGVGPVTPANYTGAVSAGGWNGYPVYTVGSVTDIPLSSIVSFVHNAV